MATVPHPVPSRTAHAIAALYGHDDDTLVAWQRACAQAAEALRPQHDPERLSKALALAQGGHVEVEEDGFAVVTSGTKLYHVQADGNCDCPDYQNRRTPCKHVLAVLIHTRAQELAAPSPSPALAASAPAQPTRQVRPPSADRWDVHEAPASCCLRLRVGELELMYTMRGVDDAELLQRMTATLPHLHALLAACEAPAPSAPSQPTPPEPPPAAPPQPDMPTLLQAALQQVLATAQARTSANGNGHASRHGMAPSAASPNDQQTGVCSLHQEPMTRHSDPDSGDTWYSHYLDDAQRYCKGARPTRRHGHRR